MTEYYINLFNHHRLMHEVARMRRDWRACQHHFECAMSASSKARLELECAPVRVLESSPRSVTLVMVPPAVV